MDVSESPLLGPLEEPPTHTWESAIEFALDAVAGKADDYLDLVPSGPEPGLSLDGEETVVNVDYTDASHDSWDVPGLPVGLQSDSLDLQSVDGWPSDVPVDEPFGAFGETDEDVW